MSRDRSLVRASDIGMWAHCQRAWWLAKVKGAPHANPALLEAGTASHRSHGVRVARAATLTRVGLGFLAVALLLASVLLILWIVSR